MKAGEENVIAVRVDHSRQADSQWYTGSGVFLVVWENSTLFLIAMNCQWLVCISFMAFYQLNKQYIAEALFVNRKKPELRCLVKCLLTKKPEQTDPAYLPLTATTTTDQTVCSPPAMQTSLNATGLFFTGIYPWICILMVIPPSSF